MTQNLSGKNLKTQEGKLAFFFYSFALMMIISFSFVSADLCRPEKHANLFSPVPILNWSEGYSSSAFVWSWMKNER